LLAETPPSGPERAFFLSARFRPEFGRRAIAMVVALALEALLLLALLTLGRTVEPPQGGQLTEVSLEARDMAEPEAEEPTPENSPPRPNESSAPQPVETSAPEVAPAPTPVSRIPLPTAPLVPPPAEARPAPPRAVIRDQAAGPPNTGAPQSSDSERVGTAPDGSPLYAAQWYREPGEEFRGFLSAASPGWGLMACRTIANFYVADCVPLGETPGSRLNRSMLAGAGVLRVRPPRLGGRSLVGSWVRIRIDYTIRRE
jgi:protein TonB